MEHLSNDQKDHPNQHENSNKLYNEMLSSQEINKSKRAGVWQSQSGIPVGKLTIWAKLFEMEKLQ